METEKKIAGARLGLDDMRTDLNRLRGLAAGLLVLLNRPAADPVSLKISDVANHLEAALAAAVEAAEHLDVACPYCGGVLDRDPSDDSIRYCSECGKEPIR